MRGATLTIAAVVCFLAATGLASTRYPEWAMSPCQPDPFCNLATGSGTWVYYRVGCDCRVTIEITDGVAPVVLRTLIDCWHTAGTHSIFWDGRDDIGFPVPDGTYRFTLVARDEFDYVLYTASATSHVWCASPVEFLSWGTIKALYAP